MGNQSSTHQLNPVVQQQTFAEYLKYNRGEDFYEQDGGAPQEFNTTFGGSTIGQMSNQSTEAMPAQKPDIQSQTGSMSTEAVGDRLFGSQQIEAPISPPAEIPQSITPSYVKPSTQSESSGVVEQVFGPNHPSNSKPPPQPTRRAYDVQTVIVSRPGTPTPSEELTPPFAEQSSKSCPSGSFSIRSEDLSAQEYQPQKSQYGRDDLLRMSRLQLEELCSDGNQGVIRMICLNNAQSNKFWEDHTKQNFPTPQYNWVGFRSNDPWIIVSFLVHAYQRMNRPWTFRSLDEIKQHIRKNEGELDLSGSGISVLPSKDLLKRAFGPDLKNVVIFTKSIDI